MLQINMTLMKIWAIIKHYILYMYNSFIGYRKKTHQHSPGVAVSHEWFISSSALNTFLMQP